MPPTKLPDRHPAFPHSWFTTSVVTKRSEPTAQRPIVPARPPLNGHGSPSAEAPPHPALAAPPLTPWQPDTTVLPTGPESP